MNNMEVVTDAASLDVELLQLPEFSALALKSNFNFVEKLFEEWLSLPESNRLVRLRFISFPISCVGKFNIFLLIHRVTVVGY